MTSSSSPGESRPGLVEVCDWLAAEAGASSHPYVRAVTTAALAELDRLREQRHAVLALHQCHPITVSHGVWPGTASAVVCSTCQTQRWPCPSARALGVSE